MTIADLRNRTLAPGVLWEPTPGSGQVVLWLPGAIEGDFRFWERLSTAPGAKATLENGLWRTQATVIQARQKLQGVIGRLADRFRGGPNENRWVLPTGEATEQVGERSSDRMLCWQDEHDPALEEAEAQARLGPLWSVRMVGDRLFVAAPNVDAVTEPGILSAPDERTPLAQAKDAYLAARQAGDCPKQAVALTDLGIGLLHRGETKQAVSVLQIALGIASRLADPALIGDVRLNLGWALIRIGRLPAAQAMLESELVRARANDEPFQAKAVLDRLGLLHACARQSAQAIAAYAQALAIARDVQDGRHQSRLLWSLAIQHAELGSRGEALRYGEVAVALLRELESPEAPAYQEHLEKYRSDDSQASQERGTVASGDQQGGYYRHLGVIESSAPRRSAQAVAPTSPRFLRMAWSAARSLARYVTSGMRVVTDVTYRERLEACGPCPHHTGIRCRLCGCFTALKARLPHERCPASRWKT